MQKSAKIPLKNLTKKLYPIIIGEHNNFVFPSNEYKFCPLHCYDDTFWKALRVILEPLFHCLKIYILQNLHLCHKLIHKLKNRRE